MRWAGLAAFLAVGVACSYPRGPVSLDAQSPARELAQVVHLSVEVEVPKLESATEETMPDSGEPPLPPPPPKPQQPTGDPGHPNRPTQIEIDQELDLDEKTPEENARDDNRRPKRPKTVAAAAVRSAQGALDPAEVQKAVESAIETFRPCLRTDTVVVLDARVTPDGDVTEAQGISSRPEDPFTRDCVAHAFRSLRLGNTGSVESSTFRLSLSLKRRG